MQENTARSTRPHYDESCYLCPGNKRSGGQENPVYSGPFVFKNDFSPLLPDTPKHSFTSDPLFCASSERGMCKVICFTPRHDLSVPQMSLKAVSKIIRVWCDEYRSFQLNPDIAYALIFENKGDIMGCSNPHPHCQIWASSSIPQIVEQEQKCQRQYMEQHGRPMLQDYLDKELEFGERVIYQNDHFAVVVPFWAVWPFEALILPKQHRCSIDQLSDDEITGFADAYRALTIAYDGVFDCEFPYTAGIHQAPTISGDHSAWQMHMHFYPPLLRSATVKKFMVGYEMLASPQRDITAEGAAETLRKAFSQKNYTA